MRDGLRSKEASHASKTRALVELFFPAKPPLPVRNSYLMSRKRDSRRRNNTCVISANLCVGFLVEEATIRCIVYL
jgi:hypothetical protein